MIVTRRTRDFYVEVFVSFLKPSLSHNLRNAQQRLWQAPHLAASYICAICTLQIMYL